MNTQKLVIAVGGFEPPSPAKEAGMLPGCTKPLCFKSPGCYCYDFCKDSTYYPSDLLANKKAEYNCTQLNALSFTLL